MIAENATTAKDIMITHTDFDRLRGLIDSPRYRRSYASSLAALKDELDRSRVVAPGDVPRGVVTMHSRVRVRDLESQERDTYTLVYPEEADINDGKLSILAPLGIAMLGTRAGQVLKCDAPAGPRQLKVEKILYQPEAADASTCERDGMHASGGTYAADTPRRVRGEAYAQ
jgi:regulator of nucleoside diphosphate kinase